MKKGGDTMYIKLTEQQLNNLKAFLLRVDLKGSEVGAFTEILGVISRPTKDAEKAVK